MAVYRGWMAYYPTEVYPSAERPNVTYVNLKYFEYLNLTARRYSRRSPIYYMELHALTLFKIDNNVVVHFFYYEFLSNRYMPTFVEAHVKMCDMEKDDFVIGVSMRNALQKMLDQQPPDQRVTNSTHCPYPPGKYDLVNMTTPRSPLYRSFPFQKGRIYINVTVHKELVAEMYIDLEIKNFY
ncbi:unnamed protein product [Colias eurytheme]|nr:unnamed protein product [Colias eurytheme]